YDDPWVYHCPLHLFLEFHRLLNISRKSCQHIIQDTAGFAGSDHVHIQIIEYTRMSFHCISKGRTRLDITPQLRDYFTERFVFQLFCQYVESLYDGYARLKEGRKLTCKDNQVFLCYLFLTFTKES